MAASYSIYLYYRNKRSHQLDSIEHEQCHFRLHAEKAGSATAAAVADDDDEQWEEKKMGIIERKWKIRR